MITATLNNSFGKLPVKCAKCDREMNHYNTFTSAINVETDICWECTDRGEKGFNTKRDWKRRARQKF